MTTASLLALVSYGLAAALSMAFGAIYLVRSRFMPYHQEALGLPWQEVDPRVQTLSLALMRTAGGGLLASGIGAAAMLLIPFLAGETWPRYAIPVVALVAAGPAYYATMLVRRRTQAHSPVVAGASAIVLIVLGILLSLF